VKAATAAKLPFPTFKVCAYSDGLRLIGTDTTTLWVSVRVPAEVTEVGEAVLSPTLFKQVVSLLGNGEVEMEVREGMFAIFAEEGEHFLPLGVPDFFPLEREKEGVLHPLQIPPTELAKAIELVQPSASKEKMSIHSSVVITKRDGLVDIFATDTFRMSVMSYQADYKGVTCPIPLPQVPHLLTALSYPNVSVEIEGSHPPVVWVTSLDITLTLLCMSGELVPNHKRVLEMADERLKPAFTVDGVDLLKRLQRLKAWDKETRNLTVRATAEGNSLTIELYGLEMGDWRKLATEKVKAEVVNPCILTFNPAFVYDTLKAVKPKGLITVKAEGKTGQGLVELSIEDVPNLRHIFMEKLLEV